MTIPPWLNINPNDYLNAMEAGSRTGLQERQIGDSEREDFQRNALEQQQLQAQEQARQVALAQRQQQAEEFSAGQSLQRDKLVADTALTAQQQQQMAQQQAAANALRQTQLQQAGLLGQGRLDAENTRNENEDEFHQGELDNQSAANDLRRKSEEWRQNHPIYQPVYVPPVDADPGEEADVTPASNGSWNPSNWGAGAHPAITNSPAILPTPKIPGHYERVRVSPDEDSTSGNTPAAASLTPPTAGTGTSALPPSVAPQGYASPPGGGAMVPLPDAADGLSQSPASKYKSADDVKKAYYAGQLTQKQAVQILQSQFELE
jgi:hypothetical protein